MADGASEPGWVTMTVSHRKHNYSLQLPDDATVADLFDEMEAALGIPVANQKLLVPKGPLLKAPFQDAGMPLRGLQGKTLTLIGSGAAEVQAVGTMAERVARRNVARLARGPKPAPTRRSPGRTAEEAVYTFLRVRALAGLPHPERSEALLVRLKEDAGIRAAMREHRFSVALLTEMEPLAHTQATREGTARTLGLNRNRGEVIELRLRTDVHDGYRDYRTIRRTLCHELAHNIHGPHDAPYWELCREIERGGGGGLEDGGADGGRGVATDGDGEDDGGGGAGGSGLSRRELLAQAALEQQRREAEAEGKAGEKGRRRQG